MKKLLFLGACLIALTLQPVMAQTVVPDVVVVRIVFVGSRLMLAVSRGEGKTETTQMDMDAVSPFKNIAPVAEAYQRMVVKLIAEGYTLKGMNGDDTYATLIFVKAQ